MDDVRLSHLNKDYLLTYLLRLADDSDKDSDSTDRQTDRQTDRPFTSTSVNSWLAVTLS